MYLQKHYNQSQKIFIFKENIKQRNISHVKITGTRNDAKKNNVLYHVTEELKKEHKSFLLIAKNEHML
jgi:hypothetical protein